MIIAKLPIFNRASLLGGLLLSLFLKSALSAGGSISLSASDFAAGQLENVEIEQSALTITGHWGDNVAPFSTRYEMGFSYDVTRNQYLVFGGQDHLGSVFGDTWHYDSSSGWTQKTPPGPPVARYGHELVWIGDQYLLFGGRTSSGQYLNDTWIYDVTLDTWTFVVTPSSPTARINFSMAYSSGHNKVVLFGGQADNGLTADNFTWIFNVAASSWSQLSINPNPSFRQESPMVYDAQNQRMILFGGRKNGWDPSDVLNDTWSFDIANQIWEQRNPSSPPTPRTEAAMLYDVKHGQVVLFGGRNPASFYHDGILFYHYGKNRWLMFSDPSTPAGRYGHKMVYNSASNTGLSLGGKRDVTSNTLWSYTLQSTGVWTSAAIQALGWTPLNWNAISLTFSNPPPPSDTSIHVQLASSVDGSAYDSFRGPDGSTSTFYVITSSTDLKTIWPGHANQRFLKIKARFVSDDIPSRPHVTGMKLDYNQAPTPGVLKGPADGSRTNKVRPTFNWQLSADNDGDSPLLYHLEVASTTNFASPDVSVENIPKNDFDVSYMITTDLSQATWYWRVRAKDPAGLYGEWSPHFSLLVDTTTPPGPITQLAATRGPKNGEVTLAWTFPGDDDGRLDNGTARMRFSLQGPILTEANWNGADGERTALFSLDPGATIQTVVTGLADGTTYFFAIKTVDELGNVSNLSTVSPSTATNSPPGPVTQMAAAKGPSHGEITLHWTFPGDDGGPLNNGILYVRFSSQGPILSEASWDAAQEMQVAPFSAALGQAISTVVSNLTASTTYFFNIKVKDPQGYTSNLSTTSPSAVSNGPPAPVTQMTASVGASNGEIKLSWTFPGDDDGPLNNGIFVVRFSTRGPIQTEADWSAAEGERTGTFSADIGDVLISTITGLPNATTYFFSIKTEDTLGGRSVVSTVSPFTMTNAPPIVHVLFPNGGESLQGVMIVTWTLSDPNGDTQLIPSLQLSSDGGASYPLAISAGLPYGTTSYAWNTQQVPNGNSFRIRVTALDPKGLSGTDSSDGNFQKQGFNDPPNVSFISSPQEGEKVSGNLPVEWAVSNPSPYIAYAFNLLLSSNMGSSYTSVFSGTQTKTSIDTNAWPNLNTYQLKIITQDSSVPPLTSTVTTIIFGINNPLPPKVFNLIKPLEQDFPTVFDLSFLWEAALDPNGDNPVYTLRYSTNAGLTDGVVVSSLTDVRYTPPLGSLVMDTTYYWRVTARDSSALESQSPLGRFILSRHKAKSPDRLLTVEVISGLPPDGYIHMADGRSTHSDAIDRSKQDAVGDRLIKILSYPAWDVRIRDLNQNTLSASDIALRLTFSMKSAAQTQALNNEINDVQLLRIATLNEVRGRWEIIPIQKSLTSEQEVQGITQGIAVFTVVGAAAPSHNLAGLTNFPNPFAAGKEVTRIRYVLVDDAKVTIRIYTLLGDLVRHMEFSPGTPGATGSLLGFTNEVTWDGRNDGSSVVANGIYLAEIRTESAGGTRKEIRRIGVLK